MAEKILVTKSSLPTMEEYIEEIKDIWETHWLTNMGLKHQKLQAELCKYLMVSNVELLTNGHMALELSIQAMEFEKGAEVITTPFTFASTTHAIVRNGLIPVFCDINPIDFTIDISKIEELITPKTCAIVPVHVYGNICNVDEIQKLADEYNLKVIYDAAHAFGITYRGNGIGSFGDASCFSFHATKVFNTIEGGAVCYSDEKFGRKLYGLKNFGIRDEECVDSVGANAKMNEFCAAMGLCNLNKIEVEIEKRREVVEHYRSYLKNIEGIQLNPIQKEVTANFSYFPVVVNQKIFGKSRDDIQKKLNESDILARKYFYPLTSMFQCYEGMYDLYPTPKALEISRQVLTLPLYADLRVEDVERICDIIIGMCR